MNETGTGAETQAAGVSASSAASSLAGYLYQCRYALLESLRRLRKGEQFCILIEVLDDVAFTYESGPPELLQTKHHLNNPVADLSDSSPALWKSIRTWGEALTSGRIPPGSILFLVTTGTVAPGNAAYYLKSGGNPDCVTKAIERLDATANSSTSKENAEAYAAFRGLPHRQKEALIAAIWVVDGAPTITDLDTALRQEVYFAAPRPFLDSFLQRLEGWWVQRVVQHVAGSGRKPILSEELEAEMNLLREQFKEDNLPIDEDIMTACVEASGYENRTFVHQLRLIEIGTGRILHAIRNYFRAFEHRSRWIREDLLLVGELDRYESALVDEWDLHFQQMCDELGVAAAEEAKKRAAQELYKWVETEIHPPIRRGVTEPSIARGTYQMLADSLRVGWHPEFLQRLKQLLECGEVSPGR